MFDTMFDTWVTKPPVEVIKNPIIVQSICGQFIDDVRKSERPASETPRLSWWRRYLTPWNLWAQQQKEERERLVWKNQKSEAWYYAEEIDRTVANREIRDQFIFCVYKPGKVVGLMSWWIPPSRKECLVWAIAMLPGRESEAAILIEYAVELSKKAGYDGRTRFPNWNSKALTYRWLQSQYVVPRDEKDAWVEVGGEWRLAKYLPMRLTLQQAPVRLHQNPGLTKVLEKE